MPSSKPVRFIAGASSSCIKSFRAMAEEAAKLKPYGQVLLNVSTMAGRALHEIPEGGNSWHEYAVHHPSLHRVFPHPKIAPHIPADFVKANREILLAKAEVLRELGLRAWFAGHEPYFLPESFFREYPHLRGPRIDHPRRSHHEEFAICTDLDESREMYEWMMMQLKKNVPELDAFKFNANDAGSGFCWAAALYPGVNGPKYCRGKSAGQRVGEFIEVLHRGAKAGGGDISVFIGHANFWNNELYDILTHLPPNTFFTRHDESVMGTGGFFDDPVRGVNPLEIITAMERLDRPEVTNVFTTLDVSRPGGEPFGMVHKSLDIVIDCIEKPAKGLRQRLDKLHEFSTKWAGEEKAECLTETFYRLARLFETKRELVPWYSPGNHNISVRHITRPLVFNPECLSPEEEAYFLPYIFNIHESEARTDYIDVHGSRIQMGSGNIHGNPRLLQLLDSFYEVAAALESLRDCPEGEWLFNLATAVRVYASLLRSTYNFYFGQMIRDRHARELACEEPKVPDKVESASGEGEILAWNERMRDEFDNANELKALLEERGTDHVIHADDEQHESVFTLGPNIIDNLRKKVEIMRKHWLDVEKYLAPPMK